MRHIAILLACLVVLGCQRQPPEIQAQIDRLEAREAQLEASIQGKNRQVKHLNETLGAKAKTANELETIIKSKGDPIYIVKLKSKKSSFTLDPIKHMKDESHAVEFEIPVDRDFYHQCVVGEKLASGSTPWSNTWGSVNITVVSKRMEVRP